MKDKKIKKMIDNIGEYNPSDAELSMIGNLADKYMDKSDEDIFVEIIRVKSEMEDQMSEEQFATILEKLESIRPMLSEEQNTKLDKILEMLDKNK
ncbi:hypothetical protein KQI38_00710 [Tissierella carlieri]|jgi:hypothetical protein|uniref:Uncharacterized protein n=1 Tax=Tissierella carlieri TaxID=689904 RepID=A0ABT1SCM4_9FIRM|nr:MULTISPECIES: hypothetical protein [Tissierella]MBU5310533.1 hypothetical protein [Tissierella carlieri]MCQ4924208.1 hypothetical protein [Tissierella carlieri]MDU5080857.1 hypothetical protein [Bacillota bacterium]OZV11870.1 hypothetical protein CIW83_12585 [Tissierella sp. P1]